MTPTELFYQNDVFVEEIDFTPLESVVAEPPLQRESVPFGAFVNVAAIAVVGLLALHTPMARSWTYPVEVHQRIGAPRVVPDVPIPASHAAAAARFRLMFKAVPLADVERLPDPDYGL